MSRSVQSQDAREAKNPEDADAAAAARDSERLEKIKSTVIELEGTPELRRAMLALLSDAAEEAHPTDRSTLGACAGRRAAPVGSAPARTMPQPQQQVRSHTPHAWGAQGLPSTSLCLTSLTQHSLKFASCLLGGRHT